MAFSMQIPNTEVIQQQLIEEEKPKTEEEKALEAQAKANAEAIMNLDIDKLADRQSILQGMDAFGMDTMQRSGRKNALLQVPVGQLSKSGDEGAAVSNSLMELNMVIKDLDPSGIDFLKGGKVGKLTSKIRSYFARYEKTDAVIGNILQSLDKGETTLKNDNVTLELERQALRELTIRLNQEIAMGAAMDEYIEHAIDEARARGDDPDKIRFVSEEVLFPLRQRLMDMQAMLNVNQQGVLAIEVIRRNNLELIRGVERAKTVTVAALRVAVMVASALYNQQIVLKKIQALNQTTNDIIAGTSSMLRHQGTEIQRQAIESTVSVETLRSAYADVIGALDEIAKYKQEALPKMKQTVIQFQELAKEGEKQITRIEKGRLALGE